MLKKDGEEGGKERKRRQMDRKYMHEGVKKRIQRKERERERGGGCSSDVINDL